MTVPKYAWIAGAIAGVIAGVGICLEYLNAVIKEQGGEVMLINLLIEWLVDAIESNDIEKATRIQFVLNRIRKERMN